ncbi:MAG TPA: hypothetical protein VL943_03310 [Niabella sp.]|nr:hypothetical protein [Niabella sp.]
MYNCKSIIASKVIKFYFVFFFCMGSTVLAVGQSSSISNISAPAVIPPSPDAASLMRYVSVPVNHSTGVPEINIALYNVKQGELELPISISYHSGGIKVRDIASVVGLGWSLNAGGMISRSVIGSHDENAVLPSYKSSQEITTAINTATAAQRVNIASQLNQMEQGFSEFKTDRYGFNFNGHAGVFRNVKSASGQDMIYTLPYKPWKVEKKYELGSLPEYQRLYYVITDDVGIQYQFKRSETTDGVITGWRLVKITSADLTAEIRLYYSGGESIFQAFNTFSVEAGYRPRVVGSGSDWERIVDSYPGSKGGFNSEVQQLDSIVCENVSVKFSYLKDRHDGRTTRLRKMTVESKGFLIKDVEFDQSYFGSSANHTARMKLDSLRFKHAEGATIEKYGFTYNTSWNLPGYYYTPGYTIPQKIQEDYWGFWNGPSGGGVPKEFLSFLTANEALPYNGERNPVSGLLQAYILQEIKYPTGGKAVFEFEPNQTTDPYFYGYINTNAGVVGGLRVKRINLYSADNVLSNTRTYEYNSVDTYQRIQASLFQYQYTKEFFNASTGPYMPSGSQAFNGCMSTSNYPLDILDNCPVSYSKVTEYEGTISDNIGKTVFHYYLPENPTQGYSGSLLPPWRIGSFQSDKGNPVALLMKVEKFRKDGNDFKRISAKENFYTKSVEQAFVTGISLYQDPIFIQNQSGDRWREPIPGTTYGQYLSSFQYEDLTAQQFARFLLSTSDSVYFDDQSPLGTKTNFEYNNIIALLSAENSQTTIHTMPLKKTFVDSRGKNLITTYTYASDYNSSPYTIMVQKNMLNSVIDQKKYVGNIINLPIDAIKVDFATWNGNLNQIYPSKEYGYRSDLGTYEVVKNLLGYDSRGNLTGFSQRLSAPTTILWGYGSQYPVVKVVGSDYATVSGIVDQASIDSATGATGNDAGVRALLQNIRTHFSANPLVQVSTYTYKPLVGMTSETDPAGRTIYYEYDSFNRLKLQKDEQGNILKKYCYNYAGQPIDCN